MTYLPKFEMTFHQRILRKLLQNRKIQLLVIALVTVFTYINILGNGFAWDDRDFLIDWPQIKSTEGLPAYLSLPDLLGGNLPLNHRGVYRPIRSVYYLASYAIWGENASGYHLQAIIVHTLIVIVIYLITELITKKRPMAFIVAILFATHPIHTETVTYTAASMDTLGILFFFLSFYCYLKMNVEKIKKNTFLLASIIYGFLAVLIYEMTLVLPLLIVLYDFSINKFSFSKLITKINIYKNYFFIPIIYVLIKFVILRIGSRADYLGTVWVVAANQARVGVPEIFANYFFWLVWPVNLTINHKLPNNVLMAFLRLLGILDPSGKLTIFSANVVFVLPIFYILAGLGLTYFLFRKYPLIFFGLSWLMISMLTVFSIIPQGATMAERFLYIPSFGFSLLSGLLFYWGFLKLYKSKTYKSLSVIVIILFSLTIVFYSYSTLKRNKDWRTNKTIWQSAIKIDPSNPLPYKALAAVYSRENRFDEAINLYQKALEISQPDEAINLDLGWSYEKKGEREKAITEYQKALEINPNFYIAHIYLGHLYLKENNFDLAEKEYNSALKNNPNNANILSYLGDVYYNQKKYQQALEFYNKALNLDLNLYDVLLKIGQVYLRQSKYDAAIESLNKSKQLYPKQPQLYLDLADAYEKMGNAPKATEALKEGLLITPNDTLLQDTLKRIEETGK